MGRLRRWTALIALLAAVARAQVPTWPQTWQMNRSTILMTCNYSGFTDPRSTVGWAIVDYDWSNAKGTGSADGWAKHKPMDCEEMLVKQVQMAHALSPNTGYFIYRNAIKALNWYTTVRTKLDDPTYASWFLKFNWLKSYVGLPRSRVRQQLLAAALHGALSRSRSDSWISARRWRLRSSGMRLRQEPLRGVPVRLPVAARRG